MPATRAAMGARGAAARKAVLKARAADMVGKEEMDCGMGSLRSWQTGVLKVAMSTVSPGLGLGKQLGCFGPS